MEECDTLKLGQSNFVFHQRITLWIVCRKTFNFVIEFIALTAAYKYCHLQSLYLNLFSLYNEYYKVSVRSTVLLIYI